MVIIPVLKSWLAYGSVKMITEVWGQKIGSSREPITFQSTTSACIELAEAESRSVCEATPVRQENVCLRVYAEVAIVESRRWGKVLMTGL